MRILTLTVLMVSALAIARAQSTDPSRIGPQPGSQVTDFQLPDQHGKTQSLASLAGAKGTVLVFFRSAEWCPYCKTQLLELQRNVATVTKEGYGLAAISYDRPETLRAFADGHGLTFPLLSDTGSKTIAAWGLLNREATGREAGIPHPGLFIIGRDRRVIDRAFEGVYQERSTAASLLLRIGAPLASAAAQPIAAPHLGLRVGLSDATAAPGERLTLFVDATPGPKIHVYSPEEKDYIPVALKLNGSPEFRAHPVKFPPSGKYFFAPLNQTVLVYDKPFRVMQDVTLSLSPELRKRATGKESIAITGTFDYQACDDAVCYRPESVPVTWRIGLTAIAR
jgi:peroxiredoxin